MKQYNVIFTHNPQDFFNGAEPDELTEFIMANDSKLPEILKRVDGGYYAIISKSDAGEHHGLFQA